MILSEMVGLPVLCPDGSRAGWVIDARFRAQSRQAPAMTLHGLVISPHAGSSLLGYERTEMGAPGLIYRFLRWRHRHSFLVCWGDISQVGTDHVQLREGYRRLPARLPGGGTGAAAGRQRA